MMRFSPLSSLSEDWMGRSCRNHDAEQRKGNSEKDVRDNERKRNKKKTDWGQQDTTERSSQSQYSTREHHQREEQRKWFGCRRECLASAWSNEWCGSERSNEEGSTRGKKVIKKALTQQAPTES
jgi:hypothetical protein